MGSVWDTSKYHPRLSVSMLRSQSSKAMRSGKGQAENFGIGGVIHVLCQFFVNYVRKDHRSLFERPK